MKIIYDHRIFARQKYGGISRYFLEIARRMPLGESNSAKIFAPFHINAYLESDHAARGMRLPKFRGSTLAIDTVNSIIGHALIKSQRNINIFHSTYYAKGSYAPAWSKRVLTVFDMIHERLPESFADGGKTSAQKRSAVQKADHIICISENTRRDLIHFFGVPPHMTSVVYLGHSLTSVATDSRPYRLPQDTPYLLYVGNRSGYKNFANLVAAYAQSIDLPKTYALVCFGGGKFTREERELVRSHRLPIEHVVHVEGDDSLLSRLYSGAAAFIYPSLYEGFGIPPLEAMAHNCPVLCSNTSSLPEVVGVAAELFDPNDPDDIRSAIERVVSSRVVSTSLIARGRERIAQFSWDKCASETLDIYKQLIRG
ncbi:glycosyltransferase family 4 protein [Rhodanobacter sp. 7MK24]|uniref:glycosyltransferase family 4 protein n=1 Tax=Rhodanobacter sp. 7MK24 TaxID=2775922 RepID=UPI00177B107F|nr:glycosyltransferase family 1 protein [Rhodanobacter sp. 7MK24]MBD8880542.1 glycosyltransferase family 4 protein [Rhodanobacter sp. 7MK24]